MEKPSFLLTATIYFFFSPHIHLFSSMNVMILSYHAIGTSVPRLWPSPSTRCSTKPSPTLSPVYGLGKLAFLEGVNSSGCLGQVVGHLSRRVQLTFPIFYNARVPDGAQRIGFKSLSQIGEFAIRYMLLKLLPWVCRYSKFLYWFSWSNTMPFLPLVSTDIQYALAWYHVQLMSSFFARLSFTNFVPSSTSWVWAPCAMRF